MLQFLPLVSLLISGICGIVFNLFKVGKYGAIISSLLFVPLLFIKTEIIKFNWFVVSSFSADFSFCFSETAVLLCLIISLILDCLYLAKPISFFDPLIERKFGILNIFVFVMCLAILADNILQFYIAVEALGLISTILVTIEKDSERESTRVFFFNKLASIMFLIAISILVKTTESFDISRIREVCYSDDYHKLFFPASLLLVSCLCKGAQLPFSYWLLDAVRANVFASILIHAGTIIAVGIIFITKFYFLFDCFPILQKIMLAVGMYTSFWMACCALSQNDVKKVIACLTASSAGIMFMSCGLGGYSLAILYFICHAFFKSMLFLSFAYLIFAISGERDLRYMGGTSAFAPKVTDIIWISFLFASGFPFLPGFFAKISFMGTVDLAGMNFLNMGAISISILSIAAMFRMIFKSLYGESGADELTLSRSSKSNDYDMKAFWILASLALIGSFTIWSIFEWGDLHFGKAGIVYTRDGMDYLFENFSSIGIIAASTLFVVIFERYLKPYTAGESSLFVALFRNNEIFEYSIKLLKNIILKSMNSFNAIEEYIERIAGYRSFGLIYSLGANLIKYHKSLFCFHVTWIVLGATLVIVLSLGK